MAHEFTFGVDSSAVTAGEARMSRSTSTFSCILVPGSVTVAKNATMLYSHLGVNSR
jgi:hypothetical protein